MKKFMIAALFLICLSFVSANIVEARLLPRYAGMTAGRGTRVVSGVSVRPRLRSDRKALNVFFANLGKARLVTYTLVYRTNGKEEGVSGSIDPVVGNSTSRELLFGTCSGGVCRYHTNLSNMKLEVISELTSGKKTLKRFRVRI